MSKTTVVISGIPLPGVRVTMMAALPPHSCVDGQVSTSPPSPELCPTCGVHPPLGRLLRTCFRIIVVMATGRGHLRRVLARRPESCIPKPELEGIANDVLLGVG